MITGDEVARGNPRRASEPVLMTHPQAALGYLVFKRFPVILRKKGVRQSDSHFEIMTPQQKSNDKSKKKPQKKSFPCKKERQLIPHKIPFFVAELQTQKTSTRGSYCHISSTLLKSNHKK